MNLNLRKSHALFAVKDLHSAVNKLRNAGFTVEYGSNPLKAHNAIIWFEEGPFIEIFKHVSILPILKILLKLFGFGAVLNRLNKWKKINNGWCEWSLESTHQDIEQVKLFFTSLNEPFKHRKIKRKDLYGKLLSWHLLFPNDIYFPFIMSAYNPNPKPKNIVHANGITGIKSIVVGMEALDKVLLEKVLSNTDGLTFIKEQKGLQTVDFINSGLKIEDILSDKI